MKVQIENLGAVKKADIEIGDLTIIAGENSTGKSYITYSIWKLMTKIQENRNNQKTRKLNPTKLKKTFEVINSIVESKVYGIKISTDVFQEIIEEIYINLIEQELTLLDLSKVFNTSIDRFKNEDSKPLKVEIVNTKTNDDFFKLMKQISRYNIINRLFSFDFENKVVDINFQERLERYNTFIEDNEWMQISFYIDEEDEYEEEKEEKEILSNENVNKSLQNILIDLVSHLILREEFFTNIEIATTERSGALLFNNQLYKNIGYVEPVFNNIQFGKELSYITDKNKRKKGHYGNTPIIEELELLMGGRIDYNDKDGIHFKPFKENSCKNGKCEVKSESDFLSYRELSASIRNLTFIYFYLKHQARRGDFLIIDEPEAYLHPANQNKMARIIAMMINAGLKVLITTHSDYMIRELNALVALGSIEMSELDQKDLNNFTDVSENMLLDMNQKKINIYALNNNGYTQQQEINQYGFYLESFNNAMKKQNEILNFTNDIANKHRRKNND